MTTNTSFLVLLSYLFFFAFSIKYSPVLAQSESDPVRDITGEKLRTGVEYYILPVIRGRGGGVTLASNRNGSCPLHVVQEPFEVSEGLPLTFTPTDPKKGIIRVSADLNIKFSASTLCNQSTVWRLASDESTDQLFISTNGVEGNPGFETLSNWFKINKDGDDYKLVFCPGVGNFCRPICGEIGIYIDVDGIRNLALLRDRDEVPLKIMALLGIPLIFALCKLPP